MRADTSIKAKARPRYGWDAPGIMLTMLGIGDALIALGIVAIMHWTALPVRLGGAIAIVLGAAPFTLGIMMLIYGLIGKTRTRDYILSCVAWRGDEQVLDVGAGAGLLLIGAAKRLITGQAIGVDHWSSVDLSNNSAAVTARNAAIEGVTDRVEITTGDARALAFGDATFDVVLSLLCIHNIEGKPEQARACAEIARMLKRGGTALIGDYVPTHAYAEAMRTAGLEIVQSRQRIGVALSLMWVVIARKV